MWVLVVIFVMGDTMSVRSMDYVYKDKYVCEQDASSLYYDYMATRPDKSYNVISYCSQIPKGV
jgi:hypothetical protein